MQVSSIAELDTHAVIGGGKAHAFGMSDSAEFFTVLSDTLYRDKKRAVVREVMCNAWDAHIAAGKTDQPIEVKLTDTELIIKDFGLGIADNRIVQIYCVYGASTKASDGNQTGGFGLGSKAPFAYADHFTVSSCHNGKKSVYAISRGGEETNGKPDIRTMVSVPTKETGITVSIPIEKSGDVREFSALIQLLARQGGMLVQFTEDYAESESPVSRIIDTIDWSAARKIGYSYFVGDLTQELRESRIYVLYGTVLYPVINSAVELHANFQQANSLVATEARLVLVAPPSSIGVTPSREGLSYSERTLATLNQLLSKFYKDMMRERLPAAKQIARQAFDLCLKDRQIDLISDVHGSGRRVLEMAYREVNNSRPFRGQHDRNMRHIALILVQRQTLQARDEVSYEVARLFAALAPGRGHMLRRKIAVAKAHDQTLFDYYMDRSEFLKIETRIIRRLALRCGLLDKLVKPNLAARAYNDDNDAKIQDLHSIAVAPLRTTLRDAFITPRSIFKKEEPPKIARRCYGLIEDKMTPEKAARIQIEADKLKIKVHFLERTAPARRKRDEAIFFDLAKAKYAQGEWHATVDPSLAAPDFYLQLSLRGTRILADRYAIGNQLQVVVNFLTTHYGKIAIAGSAAEVGRLKRAKVPNVIDKLLGEFSKLQVTPTSCWHYMCNRNRLVDTRHHYLTNSLSAVMSMIERDPKLGAALFNPRLRLREKDTRLEEMRGVLAILNQMPVHRDVVTEKVISEDRISGEAKKLFGHLVMSAEDAEKQFAYLKAFDDVFYLRVHNLRSTDDASRAEFLSLLAFLKRTYAKQEARKAAAAAAKQAEKKAIKLTSKKIAAAAAIAQQPLQPIERSKALTIVSHSIISVKEAA